MDVHMLLGGALSFIAVFRTQSSYDRWWEARKAWQDVVTVSRGMASSAAVALADADAAELMMMKLVGFMLALKAFLRGTEIPAAELGSLLDPAYVDDLNASECPPLAALRSLSETVKRSLPQDDPDTLFDEGARARASAAAHVRRLRAAVACAAVTRGCHAARLARRLDRCVRVHRGLCCVTATCNRHV